MSTRTVAARDQQRDREEAEDATVGTNDDENEDGGGDAGGNGGLGTPSAETATAETRSTPAGVTNDRGEETIPQDILQKYIQYAFKRETELTGMNREKVNQLYRSSPQSQTAGGVPIAVRHIESIMRMAEAHAKMHLRDHVRDDDDAAIRVMLESFIMAQKYSVRRSLRRGFMTYLAESDDYHELILHALRNLARDEQTYFQMRNQGRLPDEVNVHMDDLEAAVERFHVYPRDLLEFYKSPSFRADGFEAAPERRVIRRTF